MKLIGMLDSPYVRRVAISLKLLDMPFEHMSLSVFSTYDEFKEINPVVKAPTLITDDGIVLMESSLILEYIERLAVPRSTLMPNDPKTFARSQRIISIALAVCDKSVQAIYEYKLRPVEKQYQSWLDRVHEQLNTALALLEQEAKNARPWLFGEAFLQCDITSAVAFRFACEMLPTHVSADTYPALAAHAARAEASTAFLAYPYPA